MEEGVSSSGGSKQGDTKSSLSEEHPHHKDDSEGNQHQKQKRYRECEATAALPAAVVGCSSDRKKKKSGWDDAPSSAAPAGGGGSCLDGVASHFQSNGASSNSNGDVGLRQLQAASMAALLQNRASMSQMCRIYVGSLDYSLNELDIRHVFNPFGTIVNIDMPKEGNRSKGFCFVEFATPQMAELALATMPGFLLKGRPLKLGRPSALGVQPSTAIPSPQQVLGGLSNLFTGVATNPSASLSQLALLGGGGVQSVAFNHSATMSMLSQLPGSILNQTVASSMLLHNCLGGFSGTSSSAAVANQNQPSTVTRITIRNVPPSFSASDLQQIFQVFGPIKSCSISSEMTESAVAEMDFYVHANAKLAVDTMNGFKVAGNEFIVAFDPLQLHSPSSATKEVITKVDEAPSSESPSEKLSKESSVVLLTNMVDKSEVDDELEAEILSECSRYGRVEKVKIDVDDSESDPERIVKVFIEFANNTSATNAIPKLEGRLFGGRKIRASLYY